MTKPKSHLPRPQGHANFQKQSTMALSPTLCASCKATLRQLLRRTVQGLSTRRAIRRNLSSRSPSNSSATSALATLPTFRPSLPDTFPTYHLRRSIGTQIFQGQNQQKRPLSSTARRKEAIINPRKDEDGALMEVQITPRAANVRVVSQVQCQYAILMTGSALKANHDQGLKSDPMSSRLCRVRRLSRIPISHVVDKYKSDIA